MSAFPWHELVTQWNHQLLEHSWARQGQLEEVLSSGWLGYSAATEAELVTAEKRLGTSLPPSYRAFLAISNGWRAVNPVISDLWPVQLIDWLAITHPEEITGWGKAYRGLVVSDEDYFCYGEHQDCAFMRVEYLSTALEIGEQAYYESGLFLLNPQVQTAEGEWEAWMVAPWLPGAERYRSFLEMIQEEYRRLPSWESLP